MPDPTLTASLAGQSLPVTPDPRVATLEAQVAALTTAVAELQAPSSAPTGVFNKIRLLFSKLSPYHEVRWEDEKGRVRSQIVGHDWDDTQPVRVFHGHLTPYVWDMSDPSGNNRHHPFGIYYGVPDPATDGPLNTIVSCDVSGKPIVPLKILKRFRSRIFFDHANIDFMDSEVYKKSTGGKIFRLVLHDDGSQQWVPAATPPVPVPTDPWIAAT